MGTIPAGGSELSRGGELNNRRVALRRSVVDSHLVTVDLAFQSGALLLDLSETGIGVQALSSAPIGTKTPVAFELPESAGRVDGVGRIAWTDSSGRLGIRFEDIAELSRLRLSRWLSDDRRPAPVVAPHPAMPAWPPLHLRDEIAALRRDLTTEKLQGDSALAFIVERVRNVIRATGAVIALENGAAIVCRASSGNAPPIGATVDPNSGLSGECIRTGEIVRCEDTETDPRADRLVCRRLELRSIVIVPVRSHGRPAGVLEAFSSRARAFQSSDVLMLRRVADLVADLALPKTDSAPSPDTPPLIAAALLDPGVSELPTPDSIPILLQEILGLDKEEELPAASASEPGNTPDLTATASVAPAQESSASAAGVAPAKAATVAEPAASSAPQRAPGPVKTEIQTAAAAGTLVRGTLPRPAQPEPDHEEEINRLRSILGDSDEPDLDENAGRRRTLLMRAGAGAAVLAILLTAGWQLWRSQVLASPTPAAAVSQPTPVAATVTPQPEPARTVLPASAKNVPRVTSAPVRASEVPRSNPPAAAAADSQPQPINVPAPDLKQTATAPAAPAMAAVATSAAGEPLSITRVLGAPVAVPTLATPRVSNMSGGRLLKKVNPLYPSTASGLHGEVVLKATVDRQGRVTKVQVVRGQAILAQEAAAAVKRWRYEPFRLNGQPIEVENTIVVEFKAPGQQ